MILSALVLKLTREACGYHLGHIGSVSGPFRPQAGHRGRSPASRTVRRGLDYYLGAGWTHRRQHIECRDL